MVAARTCGRHEIESGRFEIIDIAKMRVAQDGRKPARYRAENAREHRQDPDREKTRRRAYRFTNLGTYHHAGCCDCHGADELEWLKNGLKTKEVEVQTG